MAATDTVTGVTSGSQTDVGTATNKLVSYSVTNNNGEDVSGNYIVIQQNGTLTVTKRDLTFTSINAEKVYDGTPLKTDASTIVAKGFVSGEGVTFASTGTITNVGTAENTFTYTANTGTKLFANYNTPTIVKGTLTIKPRPVTFTGASDTVTYDGQTHTLTTITANTGTDVGLAPNQTLSTSKGLTYIATGMLAGEYVGTFSGSAVILDANNTEVQGNYTIADPVAGKLTINTISSPITITAGTSSKTYDGTALTDETYTYTDGVLLTGDTLNVTNSGTITDYVEGGVTNAVSEYSVMRGDVDVTSCYTFNSLVDGKLTINKRSIKFTCDSYECYYDGQEHSLDTYVIDGDGYANNQTSNFEYTVSAKNAGVYTGAYTSSSNLQIMGVVNGSSVITTNNYSIEIVPGTLTIKQIKAHVNIVGKSATYTYDNTEHYVSGYTATVTDEDASGNEYPEGERAVVCFDTSRDLDYSGEAKVTGTNVKTADGTSGGAVSPYTMSIDSTKFTTSDTKNYSALIIDSVTQGTLTINRANATVTPSSDQYKYAKNTVVPDPEFTYTITGTMDEEPEPTFNVKTWRDSGETAGEYTIYSGPADSYTKDQGNYTLTFNEGKFTILPAKVMSVSANDLVCTYDGQAHSNPANVSVVTGTTVYYSTKTDPEGTYGQETTTVPSTTEAKTLYIKARTYNSEYEEKTVEYKLQVDVREVNVYPTSITKYYGTDDPELQFSVDSLVGTDTLTVDLSRVQGEQVGTYDINCSNPQGTALSNNSYNIHYRMGTFTILDAGTAAVSFNMNGHGEQVSQYSVAVNSRIAAPTTPSASGYKFIGWYKDAALTSA